MSDQTPLSLALRLRSVTTRHLPLSKGRKNLCYDYLHLLFPPLRTGEVSATGGRWGFIKELFNV